MVSEGSEMRRWRGMAETGASALISITGLLLIQTLSSDRLGPIGHVLNTTLLISNRVYE